MTTALEQALFYWERHVYMSREQRLNAAIELGEWGIFSARQIGAIVGIEWWAAHAKSQKIDRTGGRLDPASLPALHKLAVVRARNEVDVFLVHEALSTGTSVRVASKLTGIPETTLKRHAARAQELLEEAA